MEVSYILKSMTIIAKGIPITLKVSIISMVFGVIIGLIIGIITYLKPKGLYNMAQVYISIFRSTPNIAQIFMFYYGLGSISNTINKMNPLMAAVIVLSLNSGAYISETIRGGLISVESGQIEAGVALGLSKIHIMGKIIIPQALPIALPSLFNSFIDVVKGTSITFMIGIPEIMGVARTEGAITFRYLEIYFVVMLYYWIIIKLLQSVANFVDNKILYER